MNENSRTSWDEIYGNDLMQDLFQGLRGNSNLGALATVPQGLRITVRPEFFVSFQKIIIIPHSGRNVNLPKTKFHQ